MVSRRWLVTGLLVVVMGVGLSACGGGDDEGQTQVDLTATQLLRFEPDRLQTSLNRETVWTFRNEDDDRQHNFTLSFVFVDPETQTQNVSVDVPPGQTRDIVFTVRERPRDGFLSFHCRFHQSEGMNGRITLR